CRWKNNNQEAQIVLHLQMIKTTDYSDREVRVRLRRDPHRIVVRIRRRADLRRTRAFGLHRQRSQSKDALEVDGVRLHREIAMPEHAAKPACLFMAPKAAIPECLLSRRCWGLS